MVERLSGPNAISATALSAEVGVSQATLSRWLKGGTGTLPREPVRRVAGVLRGSLHQQALTATAAAHDLVKAIPSGRDRIIGGDMEGMGLLSVSPADKPLWAVVKGISDFADEDRDGIIELTRALACQNAVRFVLTALRNNQR